MIGTTISHYNILEKIGEGGMGKVYLANDTKLDRNVAIKFLPEHLTRYKGNVDLFEHEAKTAASLNHPNIVTIYEIVTEDSLAPLERQSFIVMEFIEGMTLREILDASHLNGHLLDIDRITNYTLQICDALSAAHEVGIIHRDIKPENIIISKNSRVKILDFGLAKLKRKQYESDRTIRPGTITYMAPEQHIGVAVDQRADIWSLGVVMYEMLSGDLPFKTDYDQSTIYAIIQEEPQILSSVRKDIPQKLEQIVNKSLQKESDKRFRNISEICKEIKSFSETGNNNVLNKNQLKKRRFYNYGIASLFVLLSLIIIYLLNPYSSKMDEKQVIAVLPFENLNTDSEDEYFNDGITEDIIDQLSKINAIRVLARSSVMQYKHLDLNLRDVAEELNAGLVLYGSIRRSEERIRIVVKLYETLSGECLWTENYDQKIANIFDIQVNIATQIASVLKIKLKSTERDLIENRLTTNIAAYEYYRKGREYYFRLKGEDNEYAIKMYKKALEFDPEYAPIYAGLGAAYMHRADPYGYPLGWYDSARAVNEKALELDPNCFEAFCSLGMLYARIRSYPQNVYREGSFAKAIQAYRTALQLNPNNYRALYLMGQVNRYAGNNYEALKYLYMAVERNPMSAFAYAEIGITYTALGDSLSAEQQFKKALEVAPDLNYAYGGLANLFWHYKNYEQAILYFTKSIQIDPASHQRYHQIGVLYKNLGKFDEASLAFNKALEIAPKKIWHSLGLASILTEKRQFKQAIKIYRKLAFSSSVDIFPKLHYVFLLINLHELNNARSQLDTSLNNFSFNIPQVDSVTYQIVQFLMGKIDGIEVEKTMELAVQRVEFRSFVIKTYYYFGMACLLNLNERRRDKGKAREYLKKYLAESPPFYIEYSLARAELKNLERSGN